MKERKKLLVVCLSAAALFFGLTAAPVEKVKANANISAPETVTFMMGGGSTRSFGYIEVRNVTPQAFVDVTTVQTSNKDVVDVERVETLLKKNAASSYSNICLCIKGEGTANVTYLAGTEIRSTVVYVKPYANPIRTISMTNINGGADFTELTKDGPNADLMPLTLYETAENPELNVTVESDWAIRSVYLYTYGKNNATQYDRYSELDEGETISRYAFRFARFSGAGEENTDSGRLVISLKNPATGQTLDVSYVIR